MAIPCYLALTAAEFTNIDNLPEKCAWMACHYSCYGTGLSNMPHQLPEGALLILNDRTPPDRHDPKRILDQLKELTEALRPDGILLDFQRKNILLNRKVAEVLTAGLSCPVAVTGEYAHALNCPVFLEPPPLHMDLASYIAPYAGREIWLEAAPETRKYTVSADGCTLEDMPGEPLPEPAFAEESIFCRYHTQILEDAVVFTLQRTVQELNALLSQAHRLGITKAVGLHQQLGKMKRSGA